jgi:hypothetical protein
MGRLALAVFLIVAGAMAQSGGFVSLVPRQDLSELWVVVSYPSEVWSLKDGAIAATGKPMG